MKKLAARMMRQRYGHGLMGIGGLTRILRAKAAFYGFSSPNSGRSPG
jgi:hypothetical protein